MKVESFVQILGSDFYTGVPDSQLKALCNYLMNTYGIDPKHHVIGANEGNCAALAAGYHLATGKVPVVYMQNSGEGNIINPAASLLNDKVYGIPVIFVVGWRGEPGIHDEPQHIYQGEVTVKLLEDMDIRTFVVGKDTTEEELAEKKDVLEQIRAEAEESGDLSAAAENHDLTATTSSYGADDESLNDTIKAAADALSDGEYADIVEGDNAYYLIHMDSTFDEAATQTKKESILEQRKQDAYTNWVDGLKESAEITTNDDNLSKLTFERVFKIKEDTSEGDASKGDNE